MSASGQRLAGVRRVLAVAAMAISVAACGGTATSPAPSAPPGAFSSTSSAASSEPTLASSPPAATTPTAASAAAAPKPGEPWLLYAWYPDAMYLVRPDGSDRQRLDLGVEGVPFAPSWSADGKRIVFVMKDAATPDGSIWTANADGSGAKKLYGYEADACNLGAYWPVWAPDGRRLALVCYHGTEANALTSISVLDTTTMRKTDLVSFRYPETTDNPPSWSPDGKMLTFEIIHWDPTDQFLDSTVVATVPTAGGKARRLTDPSLFGAHPDWSPDGKLIAFNTYDTGNMHGISQPSNVYTIKPDGSGVRQVSIASMDGTMRLGQPFWSPDGNRIWVSVARDFEKDSTDQFMNTLGWVDASTGALHEIGTEGKRFRERPAP